MSEKILVVGDRFTELLYRNDVISYSQLTPNMASSQQKPTLFFGQGIACQSVEKIKHHKTLPKWIIDALQERSNKKEIYDTKTKNHLFSPVKQSSETRFHAHLFIDNENDELQDHVTGIHLSAMVLLRAAQQFAAILKKYFLNLCSDENKNFSSIETDFVRYSFPVETKIAAKLENKSNSKHFAITFTQANLLTYQSRIFFEQ